MKRKVLSAVAATLLLAGCAGLTGQGYVDDLNNRTLSGDSFTDVLAREYRRLANVEWGEMLDYTNGLHFAQKGLAAARGEVVLPDEPSSRDLPAFAVSDVSDAFSRLSEMLASGGRDRSPEAAARAQASFDCWVEQQEENHQPDDISSCHQAFEDAMAEVGPARYLVFFDFGSARLNAGAKEIVKQAVVDAGERGVTMFDLVGHTDTVGRAGANRLLSVARAEAVRAMLIAEGVSSKNIRIIGEGEVRPLVSTKDGVREASNRRVEISLR